MAKFRPPQHILDVFWILSDGNDDQRNEGVVKLAYLVKKSETSEKRQILQYCQERLIRGLSSGRKFARIGFSVALVQLLRENEEMDITSVLSTVKNKLRIAGPEKKSQSEISGIILGQAFATSALIQAGRIVQLSGDVLSALVGQLFQIVDKKSYLTAVCDRIIQDLLNEVQADVFGKHVWPKVKEHMKQGWNLCTLDRLALVLTCRAKFPEVVKRKFLRKYWGFPVLCEANDDKLLTTVLASMHRTEILLEQILPQMLESDRDVVSIWRTIGEKLMEPMAEKKCNTMARRQVLGLKVASKLVACADQDSQIVDVVLSPGLIGKIFHSGNKRNTPSSVAVAADSLCQQVCQRLARGHTNIFRMIKKIWKLEAAYAQKEDSGKNELVKSFNFLHIIDLTSSTEADKYSCVLMAMIMGNDIWHVLSHDPARKMKQIDSCLRQLLHLSTTSKLHSMPEVQHSVLALFLRLAFFHVTTGTNDIAHCEGCINLQKEASARRLSEAYFYKLLDSLLTLISGSQKKWDQLPKYLDLLSGLAYYVQDLLKSEDVVPINPIHEQISMRWHELIDFCTRIRKISDSENQGLSSAFVLLVLFLGFHMLTDFKVPIDLLQDVYVCYEKATKTESAEDENEPHWMEVLMDVLLKVMSLHSHLARAVAVSVFRLLSQYMTANAVSLIMEVLTPNRSPGIDNGEVLVEADGDDSLHDEDVNDKNVDDEGASDHEDEIDEYESMDESSQINNKDEDFKTEDSLHADDESLSDLSDSDMFKMDNLLAEVFKQRQKSTGKKARDGRRQELMNFQIRVLDFVEILIKGERCGDFVFNLLKPLILLVIKSGSTVLVERAQGFLALIKGKSKTLTDMIHSVEELKHLFLEILDLAKKVTDKRHLHELSMACYVLININIEHTETQETLRLYIELVMNALEKVINKKSSKHLVTFFNMLIESEPSQFQELGPKLVDRLKETTLRPHDRMICCLILASLCKKTDSVRETDLTYMKHWMTEAASVVSQLILSLDKVMFYKDVLTLTAALQSRQDIFVSQSLFGADIKKHLIQVKSKFNTDIRRLANKIISSIDQNSEPRSAKKRKNLYPGLSIEPSHKKASV